MPNPTGIKNAQKNTWGGFNTATQYSGAVAPSTTLGGALITGSDVMLASGGGRLDQATIFPPFSSGLQLHVIFYDAAAPVSGGPIAASGHRVLGYLPDVVSLVSGQAPVSGNVGATSLFDVLTGVPRQFATPFQSGLCYNSRSGQPGFTVSWTPEAPNM